MLAKRKYIILEIWMSRIQSYPDQWLGDIHSQGISKYTIDYIIWNVPIRTRSMVQIFALKIVHM